jgi:hypothetical protein
MLEEIHTIPEDRAKVQLIIDASLVAFGLFFLTDGVMIPGGFAPLVLGTAAAAAGLASQEWLNRRQRLAFFPRRVRA